MRELKSQLGPVFYISAALALAFVLWGVFFTESMSSVTSTLLGYVVADFGWLYLIATTLFLAFAIYLAASRFGNLKIGKPEDQPEFNRFSWFAMLFQAGMGIGLVFWAVSEPISHYALSPPYGLAPPNTTQSADLALRYSFFHWSLHPWAIYAVIALAIAYFNFRYDRPGLISSVFYPLLGERVNGPIGKTIDVLGILATLFGVAVSLGLGALQINSGLSFLFGLPNNAGAQITIIAVTSVAFIASAATGIGRGVNWLSQASMVVAGLLLVFLLVFGPTILQLNTFTQLTGGYLGDLIPMSFRLNALHPGGDPWPNRWTLFYWATWISWAPYVGMFIARISRGRTIREFIVATLAVPSILSFLWFAVWGAAAIDLDRRLGGVISDAVAKETAVGVFAFLQHFPLALLLSLLAIALIWIFFVAGADAASIVLGRFSARGTLDPATPIKLVWGFVIGGVSAVLLLAGGLEALQNASILAALPFTFIMLAMCWSLLKALNRDVGEEPEKEAPERPEAREEPRAAPAPG